MAILALFIPCLPIHADETVNGTIPTFHPEEMVKIVNGPNWIDMNGDGHLDLVMKSRVSIWGTSHSYSVYSFFIYTENNVTNPEIYETNWSSINIIDNDASKYGYGENTKQTYEGAECIITDYRIAMARINNKISAWLIMAQRDLGEGFWDQQPYMFTFFKLENDEDPQNGYERLAFIKKGTSTTTNKDCGANEAFFHEFGFENPEAKQDHRR